MRVNFSAGFSTGEWAYDLLAAIVRRALLDAQGRGQTAEDAQDWLDFIAGERWRKTSQQDGLHSTEKVNGYLVAHQTTNVESEPPGQVTTGRG